MAAGEEANTKRVKELSDMLAGLISQSAMQQQRVADETGTLPVELAIPFGGGKVLSAVQERLSRGR